MSNLIPFDQNINLPAILTAIPDDEFSTGQRMGFPVVSIKGKVFHVVRGEEATLVCKPDSDEPAGSIEVVVIRATPGLSRTYYVGKFVEGSRERPDCYSVDGKLPADDAKTPQAKSCAACPHSQWGSRITEDGKKAMACSNFKRLAVAPVGQLNDPMLLRIPGASLKAWDEYVKLLKQRGVNPTIVATKVSFDWSVAHPALTFKPVGILTEDMIREVIEERGSPTCEAIVGGNLTDAEQIADNGAETETVAAEVAKTSAPAKKTKTKEQPAEPPQTLKAEVEEAEAAETVEIKVEGSDKLLGELTNVLDEMDFDD